MKNYLYINHYLYYPPLLTLLQISSSHAIDLQPGEVRAPKSGINFAQLTYQYSQRGDRYSHGQPQTTDTAIQTTQLQVRFGHSFAISKYPAVFYIQTPLGHIRPEKSLSRFEGDSGVGDTSFMQAFWPYANHDTQTYFGLATYLIVPTGSYSPTRAFNVGENRYRWALQAGYQTQLLTGLHGMGVADVTWFGDNEEVGQSQQTLEQQALYAGQVSLRYDFNPRYALGANYFYTTGGETSLNGVNRDDTTQLHRYQLTGIANFAFGRLTLQYGSDLDTENGYIEDQRWILRYTKFF
jgi:hypothetical protein